MPLGGSGSSASASVLTGPPVRAYGQPANDWAISFAPGAAAIRCSVPSVRSRFVVANVRSKLRMSTSVSAVIWWTITSGCARSTAALTDARSRPSISTASAPNSRRSAALASLRVVPVTVWPCSIR